MNTMHATTGLPSRTEIAVIGAGPAGATLAAALAQRGRQVLLIEADHLPRHKVCGEFLSGESMDVIDALGWRPAFEKQGPTTMTTARMTAPRGAEVVVDLPRPARGLSRHALDAFLFEQARGDGVIAVDGARLTQIEDRAGHGKRLHIAHRQTPKADPKTAIVDADLVVATWGRRTALDRQLERPFFSRRTPWVAFKAHFLADARPPADLAEVVELHAFEGGYCGASFVEDQVVNLCTMFRADLVGAQGPADPRAPFAFIADQSPALAARMQGLTMRYERPLSVAQIHLSVKAPTHRGIFFCGDAASMIAPLAGDGQAMAMEASLKLARLLADHFPGAPLEQWDRLWRSDYARRVRLGQMLNAGLTRQRLASPALAALTHLPPVARQLVSWTRG